MPGGRGSRPHGPSPLNPPLATQHKRPRDRGWRRRRRNYNAFTLQVSEEPRVSRENAFPESELSPTSRRGPNSFRCLREIKTRAGTSPCVYRDTRAGHRVRRTAIFATNNITAVHCPFAADRNSSRTRRPTPNSDAPAYSRIYRVL